MGAVMPENKSSLIEKIMKGRGEGRSEELGGRRNRRKWGKKGREGGREGVNSRLGHTSLLKQLTLPSPNLLWLHVHKFVCWKLQLFHGIAAQATILTYRNTRSRTSSV